MTTILNRNECSKGPRVHRRGMSSTKANGESDSEKTLCLPEAEDPNAPSHRAAKIDGG